MTTTWNPSDETGITLTNGNLTAAGASFNFNGVRSTSSKNIGGTEKLYFEISCNGAFSDSRSALGFATSAAALGGTATTTGHVGGISEDGTTLSSAGFDTRTVSLGAFAGQTYGFAIDIGAQKWWVTSNGTTWNAGGSADPATGVGGVTWSTQFPTDIFIYATCIDAGAAATLNPDGVGVSFAFTTPSGFTPWESSSAVTGTFVTTEDPDLSAIFGITPLEGTFNTSEHADHWSTSSGFTHFGVEHPISNNGAPLDFITDGPDRILIYVFSGVAVGLAPTLIDSITSTSGLDWQLEMTVTAGEDDANGITAMQLWWAFCPHQVSSESITVVESNNNSTTKNHLGLAISGLNGNYSYPFDWNNNALSEGSMIGDFFGFGPLTVGSLLPYATGPSQGTTAVYPVFLSGDTVGATLSNGGTTITSTGTGNPDNYSLINSASAKRTGKFYFEFEFNTINGADYGAGMSFVNSIPSTLIDTGTGGCIVRGDGSIWNGVDHGFLGVVPSNGDIIGCAVDLDIGMIWFKDITAGTDWNGLVGANPTFSVMGIPFNPEENSIQTTVEGGGTVATAPAIPVAIVAGNSSAQISFNFDNSSPSFAESAPLGFVQWSAFASTSSFPYRTIALEAEAANNGGLGFAPLTAPTGFSLAASQNNTGSQRQLASTLATKYQPNNVRASDGPISGGGSGANWVMLYATIVAGGVQPGELFATETPDSFTARGYPGSFGVIGDLTVTERPDIATIFGFERDSGILFTTENPDRFSAFMYQPIRGTMVLTEATDHFSAHGIGQGEDGVFITVEGVDIFTAIGNTPISGSFVTTEAADRFRAIGAGVIRVSGRRQSFVT